jgi:hypothetical protein
MNGNEAPPLPAENWRGVFFDGPQPDQNQDGDEIPAWFVYVGNEEAEPVGKVDKFHDFKAAEDAARRMSRDRRLDDLRRNARLKTPERIDMRENHAAGLATVQPFFVLGPRAVPKPRRQRPGPLDSAIFLFWASTPAQARAKGQALWNPGPLRSPRHVGAGLNAFARFPHGGQIKPLQEHRY